MSNIVSQYTELDATFGDGAMRLLRSQFAQTTIALLREQAPWCKVMVGGAVLNPEYARMVEAIAAELNFTSLKYHRLDDMMAATGVKPCKLCTYCWNGKE